MESSFFFFLSFLGNIWIFACDSKRFIAWHVTQSCSDVVIKKKIAISTFRWKKKHENIKLLPLIDAFLLRVHFPFALMSLSFFGSMLFFSCPAFCCSSWTRQNSQSLNKIFICLPTILMWIYFVFSMMQLCLAFLIFCVLLFVQCARTHWQRHTLIPPNARSLREHLQRKQAIRASWREKQKKRKKNATHTHIKRAKPKFFRFFPFGVRSLYQLNFTNDSHTHRSTINLFHFDFNRFMRKSFTLPMLKNLPAPCLPCAKRAYFFRPTGEKCVWDWVCVYYSFLSFACTLRQILLDICYMRI